MLNLLVFASLVAACLGHMCLLSPYQRPGFVNTSSLGQQGAAACGMTSEPCGTANKAFINAAIMSETMTFVMQKNLDHYNSAKPGNFSINLWTAGGEFVRTLGSVADDARASGSLYQVQAPIPHEGGASTFLIQAVYYTNNANAPAAFYQCADLEIYPRN
mmetsp:Transcript_35456/g.56837  ORF Transcript_35456/g.56837 Transcript_35456/m.56837 type:complete len:160 (-) Transcript_35456:159-638(-)|eukprot:CAMPEP_0197046792 /NCGR_PEP_ID=MMETSP1384-20130603/22424_1 /TAXON_ID=29189 /ORGANISM="Ammonia sp." /LENGTH=159 /DNA_ID=CAMNT_0042478631 /DNA_START=682 /DNA_END=1161 /DNA_ORIENTATION=+